MSKMKLKCKQCKPIVFKHEDGWDIYPASECYKVDGVTVPAWFDAPIVEDAPTRKDAIAQWSDFHVPALGICLAVR